MRVSLCPAHLTGFFEIKDEAAEVMKRGSRGAGICLAREVRTEVEAIEEHEIRIAINGEASTATVSRTVAGKLLALGQSSRGLAIRHRVPVPIGSGFGTSGAAAVGVALAGSIVLDLGLSSLEACQLAHATEVELKTGLGTVAGQFCGGLEMRTKEGAPGYGEVLQVPLPGDCAVVALHNGPLLTSAFLSNPEYRRRINAIGGSCSDEMSRKRDLGTFLNLSHEFTLALGLGARYSNVMKRARDHGYLLGQAMFGHTLFTVVKENEVNELVRLIRMDCEEEGQIITSSVRSIGARMAE